MRKVCSRVLKRAYCISCVFCIMCTSYYILISSWRNEENETYWGFLSFYHYCFGVFAVPRSSRPEVICKKCVLRNFTKFKVAGLSPATLLRKRLWHRCFPVNFAKFIRTPFVTEHLRWLLQNIHAFILDQLFLIFLVGS